MKRILVSLLFFVTTSAAVESSAENLCGKVFDIASESTARHRSESALPLDRIRTEIFAVHATDYFPRDGVISVDAPDSIRPELHFSLGSLVQEHAYSWENKKFAVVVPLKTIETQIVNLMAFDTMVMGDVNMKGQGIIVLPKDSSEAIPAKTRSYRYDPDVMTLRRAIEVVLEKENAWILDSKVGSGRAEDPAVVRGTEFNANREEVWQELMKLYPDITFATHEHTRLGFMDLGIIRSLQYMLQKENGYLSGIENIERFEFTQKVVKQHISVIESEVRGRKIPVELLRSFEEVMGRIKGYADLLQLEIYLVKNKGVSISRSSFEVRKHIESLLQNPSELRSYINENIAKLAHITADSGYPLSAFDVGHQTYVMSIGELRQMMKEMPDVVASAGGMEVIEFTYALRRATHLGLSVAKREGLLSIIEKGFQRMARESDSRYRTCVHILFSNADVQTRNAILDLEPVKTLLEGSFDIDQLKKKRARSSIEFRHY